MADNKSISSLKSYSWEKRAMADNKSIIVSSVLYTAGKELANLQNIIIKIYSHTKI